MILEPRTKGTPVLLDVDGGDDLEQLLGHVGERTEKLLAVCTNQFFHRAICLGEVTTAHVSGVPTLPLALPGFHMPVDGLVPEEISWATGLLAHGISLAEVRSAMQWFHGLPRLDVPEALDCASLDRIASSIVPGSYEAPMGRVVLLADGANLEALASALVIANLLGRLGRELSVATSSHSTSQAQHVLLLLTQGCLQEPRFLQALLAVEKLLVPVTPLLGDGRAQCGRWRPTLAFEVPGASGLELRARALLLQQQLAREPCHPEPELPEPDPDELPDAPCSPTRKLAEPSEASDLGDRMLWIEL